MKVTVEPLNTSRACQNLPRRPPRFSPPELEFGKGLRIGFVECPHHLVIAPLCIAGIPCAGGCGHTGGSFAHDDHRDALSTPSQILPQLGTLLRRRVEID
ncbi:hypothetical protein MMAS_12050 [Mycobacteroides abscessus subsp. massiliense CCUG 48898 = JCM 15300]|nr:hypothetical protein MMAS_12050 [Mycobacteroides abscessus subsp. massiliense CCUG 48898 = JCM 15300]